MRNSLKISSKGLSVLLSSSSRSLDSNTTFSLTRSRSSLAEGIVSAKAYSVKDSSMPFSRAFILSLITREGFLSWQMIWVEPRTGLCDSSSHFNGSPWSPIEKATSHFFLFHLTLTMTWLRWFRNVLQLYFIFFILPFKKLFLRQNYICCNNWTNSDIIWYVTIRQDMITRYFSSQSDGDWSQGLQSKTAHFWGVHRTLLLRYKKTF